MHMAAGLGDVALAEMLLEVSGSELCWLPDSTGETPLSLALDLDRVDFARFLLALSKQALPETYQPLIDRLMAEVLLSTRDGAVISDWIILLLDCGANPNARLPEAHDSRTLLMAACERGNIFAARKLLLKEANPDFIDAKGNTCLHYACRNKAHREAVLCATMLLDEGRPGVNILNLEGESALHVAIRQRSPSVAIQLLLYGLADVNIRTAVSKPPLHVAIDMLSFEDYPAFYMGAAPPPASSGSPRSSSAGTSVAAGSGAAGPSVPIFSTPVFPPPLQLLALRAVAGNRTFGKPLVDRMLPAELSARVRRLREQLLPLLFLLSDRAVLQLPYEGESLLFWAIRRNVPEIGAFLLEAPLFSLEGPSREGLSPLQLCATAGNRTQFAELLLVRGARVNPVVSMVENKPLCLLQWALDSGLVGFANLLIKYQVAHTAAADIQLRYGAIKAPRWLPDEDVNECFVCKSGFTLFRRKRHCRQCGRIPCASCVVMRLLPGLGICDQPVPVCKVCDAENATPRRIIL